MDFNESDTIEEGGSSSSSDTSGESEGFDFEMDIRYVHFKKRSYYMQGVEKILFQVVDVSKSLLYDKASAQTEFLSLINATVSHEMRNPLNSILN